MSAARTVSRLISVLACLICSTASALPTRIISNGTLIGASHVTVGTKLYDVVFIDGTCVGLFGGCNAGTFVFDSEALAIAAAQALLDTVLLDGPSGRFDSNPTLTRGCSSLLYCQSLIPYFRDNFILSDAYSRNDMGISSDVTGSGGVGILYDTANSALVNYAVFTPAINVSEPGVITLGAIGLVAYGFVARRRSTA